MGVYGYLSWLRRNNRKCFLQHLEKKPELQIIDGNCLLHYYLIPDDLDKSIEYFIDAIKEYRKIFKKTIIVFDGIPPTPKQICQKKRRQNSSLSFHTFILPNTSEMNKIEKVLVENFQDDFCEFLSSNSIGEGEQKIFDIIKKNNYSNLVIYTSDSDVVILSQIFKIKWVFIFYNKEWIDIEKLFSIDKNILLILSIFQGNDFFPKIIDTLDWNLDNLFYFVKKIKKNDDFFIFFKNCLEVITLDFCKFNCLNTDQYIHQIHWFINYFLSHKQIDIRDPYIETYSPCCFCILKNISTIELKPQFKKIKQDYKNHLNFVLK